MNKAAADETGELPRPGAHPLGLFARLSVVGVLLAALDPAAGAQTSSSATVAGIRSGIPSVGPSGLSSVGMIRPPGDTVELNGTVSTWIDWRRGHRSANIRQDLDAATDLDLHYGPRSRDWSVDLFIRGTADLDGRRPSYEPGIYNGILETYDHAVQPWLYRASAQKKLAIAIGSLAEITSARIGRQYHTDGDFLWFDGLEISGRIPSKKRTSITGSVFGGKQVRLYESATDDWLAGGNLIFGFGNARLSLEAYHLEDRDRTGVIRKDNVGRVALATPLGSRLRFDASGRYIDGEELDGRARLTANLPRNMQLHIDGRVQKEDRGTHATELDAASLIFGRSVGATRRAFYQYGGDLFIPVTEKLSIDVGGLIHEARSQNLTDTYNFEYDRFFATVSLSDIKIFRRKTDLSLTLEAYETFNDWTRTASGEARMALTKTLTGTVGTSFAIYRYDYLTGTVRDDVRTGTAKLEWRPKQPLTLEARYDLEDDDQRLHHYGRLGARYDF